MNRTTILMILLLVSTSLTANDFITQFIQKYNEADRPLNNVNIGKRMLEKMAENTQDEELRNTFKELQSIRIVSSDNETDSRYYFEKAYELIQEEFTDYEEIVSVNERYSRISVWMKKENEKRQDIILISLDENSQLSIISVSGKIDFSSIAKLSGAFKNEPSLSGH
jgi:hypothetical protein